MTSVLFLIEFAEPVEIAKLLSSFYQDVSDSDIPKPDNVARQKEDRKRLGKFIRPCFDRTKYFTVCSQIVALLLYWAMCLD